MVDPFTARKRAKIFATRKFAAEIARKQNLHQMDAFKIIINLPAVLTRIEKNSRLPPRERAFRKARFISDQAAILADAMIDAEIKAKDKQKGLEEFEALPPEKRKAIWDEKYEKAMKSLSKHPKIASDPAIVTQLNFLRDFFRLPKNIYEKRKQHWKIIKKVVENSEKNNKNPAEGLTKEIDRLLSRVRPGERLKTKAMDICIAVSIFADIMERRHEYWPDAYRDGMKLVYLRIKNNEPLLDAIAAI